jgi:hypothetical protein
MSGATHQGMRVGIAGGCQAAGLGEWIRRMLPGAEVHGWHVGARPDWNPGAVAGQVAGYDLVITQFSAAMEPALSEERLRETARRVVFAPVLVFNGLQPDIVMTGLRDQPFALLRGPLDVLQSAIILAAYHLEVPVARVPRLFNALVFEALGYLGAFAAARAGFLKLLGEQGYDFAGAMDGWLREGTFMYSDNHPHIRVLGSYAEAILARAGLSAAAVAPGGEPLDNLAASVQWPVYPAIARPLGIPGSTSFVRATSATPAGEPRAITLSAFAEASYRLFDDAGRANLDPVPRVMQDVERLRGLLAA